VNIQEMAEGVKENIGRVIVGEDEVIELALVALLGELQQ
jgi:MoxR-like ATPase